MKIKFYNLFESFKKRLGERKHRPEQEKDILRVYRRMLLHCIWMYGKRLGKIAFAIALCLAFLYGGKKSLGKYKCTTFIIVDDVNLRDAPNLNSNIIRVLHSDERISGVLHGEWLEVKENGNTYYVSKSMVKPHNSGSITLLRWAVSLLNFLTNAVLSIIRFIKDMYHNYETARAIFVFIVSVFFIRIYVKFAKEKHDIIEMVLELLCEKCGYWGLKESKPYIVDENSSIRSKVSYVSTSSDIKNSRGEVVYTCLDTTPVSKIVTVKNITTRTDFECEKCGYKFYKLNSHCYEDD